MIYVEETDFNRQIELISFLAELQPILICAWVYPESKVTELAGYSVHDNQPLIEQVSSYESGTVPRRTELVQATEEHIKQLSDAKGSLKANCDSLALYPVHSNRWVVATIGHEGMCLVRNLDLLPRLRSQGFNASMEAPSWW